MAKDGTARGSNIKVNAGRRSKGLAEKIAAGNPGKRKLKIIDIPDGADLDTSEMPEPSSYLKSKQKAGGEFDAEDIYRTTWLWLKERNCEKLISTQLLEQYAMSVARLRQCEEAISDYGFISKHPHQSLCDDGPELSKAGKYHMVPDISGGQGKLLYGLCSG